MNWYKLVDKTPVMVDIIKHPEELDDVQKNKRLHRTVLPDGGVVSTVFLSLDHAFDGGTPILFESMLFTSESDYSEQDMNRYHTWDEADEGHWEMVVKHGGTKPLDNDLDDGLFTV